MKLIINGYFWQCVNGYWYEIHDDWELRPKTLIQAVVASFGNNRVMAWVFITNHKLESMI